MHILQYTPFTMLSMSFIGFVTRRSCLSNFRAHRNVSRPFYEHLLCLMLGIEVIVEVLREGGVGGAMNPLQNQGLKDIRRWDKVAFGIV
jgi:hypothetical protein